jgi:microcystin-dependent protein
VYEPYVGEVRLFAGDFAPRGWAFCEGQTLPIQQNQALFALLGIQYGGNGSTSFALPDLRGRSPVGAGTGDGLTPVVAGQVLGAETVTLTAAHVPPHTHRVPAADAPGTSDNPSGTVAAQSRRGRATEALYGPAAALVALAPGAVASAGGSQAHDNMPPYTVLRFVIALVGIFPPRP